MPFCSSPALRWRASLPGLIDALPEDARARAGGMRMGRRYDRRSAHAGEALVASGRPAPPRGRADHPASLHQGIYGRLPRRGAQAWSRDADARRGGRLSSGIEPPGVRHVDDPSHGFGRNPRAVVFRRPRHLARRRRHGTPRRARRAGCTQSRRQPAARVRHRAPRATTCNMASQSASAPTAPPLPTTRRRTVAKSTWMVESTRQRHMRRRLQSDARRNGSAIGAEADQVGAAADGCPLGSRTITLVVRPPS